MISKILILVLIVFSKQCFAQNDSLTNPSSFITIGSFIDAFYVYDYNQPNNNKRQEFLFNHNRHNSLNLNMGLIYFHAQHHVLRMSLGLHAGTYSIDNYTNEPEIVKYLYEAFIGGGIGKKKTLWIDVGVFESNIGFESAISCENYTLSRSLIAENSPYYLAGLRATWSPNEKWVTNLILSNGWQRIKRVEGNSIPSLSSKVEYSLSDKIKLNWSSFIGTDDPDTLRRMRYFNNFFTEIKIHKKFNLIAGIDFGIQQEGLNSRQYHNWWGGALQIQYTINEHFKLAMRGEYYQDNEGLIIYLPEQENTFNTGGISLNFDYILKNKLYFRVEGRWLNNQKVIFIHPYGLKRNNFAFISSIAFNLNQKFVKMK